MAPNKKVVKVDGQVSNWPHTHTHTHARHHKEFFFFLHDETEGLIYSWSSVFVSLMIWGTDVKFVQQQQQQQLQCQQVSSSSSSSSSITSLLLCCALKKLLNELSGDGWASPADITSAFFFLIFLLVRAPNDTLGLFLHIKIIMIIIINQTSSSSSSCTLVFTHLRTTRHSSACFILFIIY